MGTKATTTQSNLDYLNYLYLTYGGGKQWATINKTQFNF